MEQLILAIALLCKTEGSVNYHSYSDQQQKIQRECAAKVLECLAKDQDLNRYRAIANCLRGI